MLFTAREMLNWHPDSGDIQTHITIVSAFENHVCLDFWATLTGSH